MLVGVRIGFGGNRSGKSGDNGSAPGVEVTTGAGGGTIGPVTGVGVGGFTCGRTGGLSHWPGSGLKTAGDFGGRLSATSAESPSRPAGRRVRRGFRRSGAGAFSANTGTIEASAAERKVTVGSVRARSTPRLRANPYENARNSFEVSRVAGRI